MVQISLSPELQRYAENIWRRFPEVFFSLGSPHVEDFFELREDGAWQHRVIDTESEKIIEIRLPKRHAEESSPALSQEHLAEQGDGDSGVTCEIDTLKGKVSGLTRWLEHSLGQYVSHEIHVRYNDHIKTDVASSPSRPKCWRSKDGLPHGLESCSGLESPSSTQAPLLGDKASPPLVSWLAIRRGMKLPSVQTKGLGKESPGTVVRAPQLDRAAGFPLSVHAATTASGRSSVSEQAGESERESPSSNLWRAAQAKAAAQNAYAAMNINPVMSSVGVGLGPEQPPAYGFSGNQCFNNLEALVDKTGDGYAESPGARMQRMAAAHRVTRQSSLSSAACGASATPNLRGVFHSERVGRGLGARKGGGDFSLVRSPSAEAACSVVSEGSPLSITTTLSSSAEPSRAAGSEDEQPVWAGIHQRAQSTDLEPGSPSRRRKLMAITAGQASRGRAAAPQSSLASLGADAPFWQQAGRTAAWRSATDGI